MQRIKASGVVSVMPPAQENSYDPGYFSNGNPATGELATMMTAEWCNGVQEELLAVIQDAKLTPSGTDLKQLLQALKYFFSTSEAEKWRKAMIGSLVPMAVSSLPGGFGMPDGSLFLFEDYPELKEKYDAGGFNGMLLEANASAEDKAAWAGKWVKHSEGIGLYAPRLSGLFLRNGDGQDGLGAYQQDTVQAGIKNIGTRPVQNNNTPTVWITGDVEQKEQDSPDTLYTQLTTAKSNQIVVYTSNQRNSDETRPCNCSLIYGIYLGVTA